jgi:hypothetical protein
MSTLYQQIGDKFLSELGKSKDISARKIDALRPLLISGNKLKVEDLVKIFASSEDDEVK